MRSPLLITSPYAAAMHIAIFIEHDDTLPQYTASGSKSTSGVIISPRPTKRAYFVPSVLILKSHIIGTRCCSVYGTISRQ